MGSVLKCCGLIVTALSAVACAGFMSGQDQDQTQALETARKERQELLFRMRSATDQEATRCEVAGKECMAQVDEKRGSLFEPSALCADQADIYEFENCQGSLLVKQGNAAAVTEFFQYENSCLSKIVGCGDKLRREADERERTARVQRHREAMLKEMDLEKPSFEIAYARERVDFLRATVPRERDTACKGLVQVKGCHDRAEQAKLKLQSELEKGDASFSVEVAQGLFQSELATQVSCFEPEYQCLMELVDEAGQSRQSEWHFKNNLKLLEQRQRLIATADGLTIHECVSAGETDYGAKIETSYANYTKDPKPPLRVVLLQAFTRLHTAQIRCLKRHRG